MVPQTPAQFELRKGCDYVDISLVDGWTLPVKLDVHGDCIQASRIVLEPKTQGMSTPDLLNLWLIDMGACTCVKCGKSDRNEWERNTRTS